MSETLQPVRWMRCSTENVASNARHDVGTASRYKSMLSTRAQGFRRVDAGQHAAQHLATFLTQPNGAAWSTLEVACLCEACC